MGVISEEMRAREVAKFREHCDDAIEEADKLVKGKKNHDYNRGGVEITDYFDCIGNPIKAAFCPCWRKGLREKSLIASGNAPENESLLDTIVDHINYLRFLYAVIKMSAE